MDRHLLLRLMPLLEAALRLPAGEREAWCQQQRLSAADLQTLKKLLAERQDATAQVQHELALPDDDALPEPISDLQPGHLIGPWQLQRELGQGGMSVVWLAHLPDQPDPPVALKIPHAGPGQGLLAQRLQRERSILASLQHPHIARLLDTGTTPQGLPYLVLEYVEGQSLLAHANARAMGVGARLQLMQQVLEAVQHAHNQLVLHRDLKPANILVTPQGQVKLLDFGIAKLLSGTTAESTALTRQGGHVLTPDYAAPEQISGGPLSTRTDVYALGVILYELLTGCRPYRLPRGSRGALEQAILSAQAEPPSLCWSDTSDDAPHLAQAFGSTPRQLHQALSGDLDVIVLKALQKQPDRRYPTADALAQDLARHLRNEPIQARGDSRWYRARKFMARHSLVLGATAAVIVSLSVGLSMALWQARQARLEAAKATAIKDFMVGLFKANDLDQVDAPRKRQQSVQDLLQDSARSLGGQGLSGQPQVRAELQGVVGTLLHDLQLSDAAIQLRQQRVALLSQSGASGAALVPAWRDLADSQDLRGDLVGMRQSLQSGLAWCQRHGMNPLPDCQGIQVLLGRLDLVEHHTADGRRRIESASQILQAMAPTHERTAEAWSALGELRQEEGRLDEAYAAHTAAMRIFAAQWGEQSTRLARLRFDLGSNLWAQGRLKLAIKEMSAALQANRITLGPDHVSTARMELSLARLQHSMAPGAASRQGIEHAAKVILAQAAQIDPDMVFSARVALLETALLDGRLQDAGQALTPLMALRAESHAPYTEDRLAALLHAWYLQDIGQYAQARARLAELLDKARQHKTPDNPVITDLLERLATVDLADDQLSSALRALADPRLRHSGARVMALIEQGQSAQALPLAQAWLARVQQQSAEGVQLHLTMQARTALGMALLGSGQARAALQVLEPALKAVASGHPGSPLLILTRVRVARALMALGQQDDARRQLQQAQQGVRLEPDMPPHVRRVLAQAEQQWRQSNPSPP